MRVKRKQRKGDIVDKKKPEGQEQQRAVEAMQSELYGIIGDLMITETWLKEGWTGTLDEITLVEPTITRTVEKARQAVEAVLKIAGGVTDNRI